MARVLIFGASGHAKVVADILERDGQHTIVGFVDREGPTRSFCGVYSILGADQDLPMLVERHGVDGGVVAVGDGWVRARVVDTIQRLSPGFAFINAVHPAASIARGATIGEGTVVMANAVVNSDARVGPHCIINTSTTVEHDVELGAFSAVLPGATVGGKVVVGAFSVVALGASVIHGVRIGEHTVVGAGATVVGDVPSRVVAVGTPARVIRSRTPGEPYL